MFEDRNKAIVRRYYEEIVHTGRANGIEKFLSEEYSEVHNGKRQVLGIAGAGAHIQGVRQTYPDLHLWIERQIA